MRVDGGLGFDASGGLGLPREPPGEAAGAPGTGLPAGPFPGAYPGAFHERAEKSKALKKRVRDVFIRIIVPYQRIIVVAWCSKSPERDDSKSPTFRVLRSNDSMVHHAHRDKSSYRAQNLAGLS